MNEWMNEFKEGMNAVVLAFQTVIALFRRAAVFIGFVYVRHEC